MTTLRRAGRAFGHFWLDFLIGDSPGIFIGTLAIVAIALGLRHERPVALPLVVVLAVVVLIASALRGRRPLED